MNGPKRPIHVLKGRDLFDLLSPRLTFGPQSAWEIERKMLVNLESLKIIKTVFPFNPIN